MNNKLFLIFIVSFFSLTLLLQVSSSAPRIALDPGVGWHLASGQWVLNNWKAPIIDPFLSENRRWVSDQWLSDLVLYVLYSCFGWKSLTALTSLVFCLTFFRNIFVNAAKLSGSTTAAFITTILSIKVAQIHFIIRPVSFSFLCFSYLIILVYNFNNNNSRKQLLNYFVLFLIWSNTHPSFIIGLYIVVLRSIIWFLLNNSENYFEASNVHKNAFKPRELLFKPQNFSNFTPFVLSLLATFINPYGISLHYSILVLGKSSYFMNYHAEWLSPNFDNIEGLLTIFITISFLIMNLLLPKKLNRESVFSHLLVITLGIMGLKAVRILPYYLMAMTVPWSLTFKSLITKYKDAYIIRKIKDDFDHIDLKHYYNRHYILPFIISLVSIALNYFNPNFYRPNPEKYPYDAIKFITDNIYDNKRLVALAPANLGGFITFESKLKVAPVIDDRNTLVGEKLYRQVDEAENNLGRMKRLFDETKADLLILTNRMCITYKIKQSDKFENIYTDKIVSVFRAARPS